ncbi:uncharacterized protein LOC113146033 isoform X2 [Mastacembelus armatus]|uniref:uncharacterized protein LOC113146033 isoform X2 n=1 Tax=Mastacembelus armatus TaxID=205130 RepID=UPI000E4597C7|nr:uncharacterized protein LOC113146033 isoform X2 [Mastacembelus armatus]
MNIHQLLFLCFFPALRRFGLVSAKLRIYTGAEGGNGTLNCHFSQPGSRTFFCKEQCKEDDILIKTDDVRATSGRYSTKYKKESSGKVILSVTFTHLAKSDSGRYRHGLGLDTSLVPDSYCDFEIKVSDAPLADNSIFHYTSTQGENVEYPCFNNSNRGSIFFCKEPCKKEEDVLIETENSSAQKGRYSIEYKANSVFGLYVTIKQVDTWDRGRYRCGYGRALSSDSYTTFSVITEDDAGDRKQEEPMTPMTQFSSLKPTADASVRTPLPENSTAFSQLSHPDYFWPLVVCVPLAAVLLSFVFPLLLYKQMRRRKTRGNIDGVNMETYQNWTPVSGCEDSVYESLDPASRDQNQCYSVFTKTYTKC